MRRILKTAIALGAMLAMAGTASAAAATWKADGWGFGHGVGLSQWGAYGYAKKGYGHKQIALHYYRGATIGKTRSSTIRVLLLAGTPDVTFAGAKSACGKALDRSRTYRAVRSGSSVVLRRKSKTIASCGALLRAKGGGRLKVPRKGRTYRGSLEVRPAAGAGLNVVNAVGLERYVWGVIANEVPSSWPRAALQAQALAARSYVLATRRGGVSDVYDDTRSQVYGGRSSETTATNNAAKATAKAIVKYGGKVAATFFFSSSGGETENVEYGMGGSPQPYLKAVNDPYDGAAPLHKWRRTFSNATMQSALGGYVSGDVTAIEVTKTGASPRIVKARLRSTTGDTHTVTGATIRARLGLPSTWVRFRKV